MQHDDQFDPLIMIILEVALSLSSRSLGTERNGCTRSARDEFLMNKFVVCFRHVRGEPYNFSALVGTLCSPRGSRPARSLFSSLILISQECIYFRDALWVLHFSQCRRSCLQFRSGHSLFIAFIWFDLNKFRMQHVRRILISPRRWR